MANRFTLHILLAALIPIPTVMADALNDERLAYTKGQCEVAVGILEPLANSGDSKAAQLLKDINDSTYGCQRCYLINGYSDEQLGLVEGPVLDAPRAPPQ